MKLKFCYALAFLINFLSWNDGCNFNQLFNKIPLNKKFKFITVINNKNYFVVNMKDCFENFEVKLNGSCLYFIKSKFNSIVVDEYVLENENSAISFYEETSEYSNKIRTSDEGKIRDICTKEQLR